MSCVCDKGVAVSRVCVWYKGAGRTNGDVFPINDCIGRPKFFSMLSAFQKRLWELVHIKFYPGMLSQSCFFSFWPRVSDVPTAQKPIRVLAVRSLTFRQLPVLSIRSRHYTNMLKSANNKQMAITTYPDGVLLVARTCLQTKVNISKLK